MSTGIDGNASKDVCGTGVGGEHNGAPVRVEREIGGRHMCVSVSGGDDHVNDERVNERGQGWRLN